MRLFVLYIKLVKFDNGEIRNTLLEYHLKGHTSKHEHHMRINSLSLLKQLLLH